MKQFNIFLLISIMALLFVGCAKQPTKTEKTKYDTKQITLDNFEADVKIDDESKAVISKTKLKDNTRINLTLYSNIKEILDARKDMALKKAFLSALEKIDTPYFVLVNPGFSNIEGFPINNFKDFSSYLNPDIKYMSLSRQKLLNNDFNSKIDDVLIIILPVEKQMLEFVVWDTEKTKNELK